MGIHEDLFNKWTMLMKSVSFPVTSTEQVFKGLAKGAESHISIDGTVICTTGELFERFLKPSDFPINTPEDLANLILNRAGI